MSPRAKQWLTAMIVTDVIFFAGVGYWIWQRNHGGGAHASQADVKLQVRHLEANLNEIDVMNQGSESGTVDRPIDAAWSGADLQEARALTGFEEVDKESGRYNVRFRPSAAVTLGPGESREIGWVKLTDDAGVGATFVGGGEGAAAGN